MKLKLFCINIIFTLKYLLFLQQGKRGKRGKRKGGEEYENYYSITPLLLYSSTLLLLTP